MVSFFLVTFACTPRALCHFVRASTQEKVTRLSVRERTNKLQTKKFRLSGRNFKQLSPLRGSLFYVHVQVKVFCVNGCDVE